MQEDTNNSLAPEYLLVKSKKALEQKADHYVANLGETISPLMAYMQAHKMAHFFTEVAKRMHAKALPEAQKHGKSHKQYDTKVEVKETGVTWDYTNCGDAQLQALEAELEAVKARLVKRQKFLQSLDAPFTHVDEETGAVTRIHPAVRKSTTKVVLSY